MSLALLDTYATLPYEVFPSTSGSPLNSLDSQCVTCVTFSTMRSKLPTSGHIKGTLRSMSVPGVWLCRADARVSHKSGNTSMSVE